MIFVPKYQQLLLNAGTQGTGSSPTTAMFLNENDCSISSLWPIDSTEDIYFYNESIQTQYITASSINGSSLYVDFNGNPYPFVSIPGCSPSTPSRRNVAIDFTSNVVYFISKCGNNYESIYTLTSANQIVSQVPSKTEQISLIQVA